MRTHGYKERIRYRIDRFFQSGFTLQLFIASMIVVAVMLIFYVFTGLFGIQPGEDFAVSDGASYRWWPSPRFWWILTHLLETYWTYESGVLGQVVSTILTLFNFLVFAAIIGLVGSKIQARLEGMRRGTSTAIENGHIVIIGWSEKIYPIIHQLYTGLEIRKKVFVLLTERPIDDVESDLKKNVGRRKHLRWAIRKGSMTDLSDLRLVSLSRARRIIILHPMESSIDRDTQVVKSIMAIGHLLTSEKSHEHQRLPHIIAEIEQKRMHELAHAAAKGISLSIIQPSDYLSKIILQTARSVGLVRLYSEILSHEKNEIHIKLLPELDGRLWREAVFCVRGAIPIGIIRDSEIILVPGGAGGNFRLKASDRFIAVAMDLSSIQLDSGTEVPPLPDLLETTPVKFVRKILLLGFNSKVYPLLHELSGFAKAVGENFHIVVVSTNPENGRDLSSGNEQLSGVPDTAHLDIQQVNEDYMDLEFLSQLNPATYDAIIVLGEEQNDHNYEDTDTRVIMTLLLLRSLRQRAEEAGSPFPLTQQIVGEILNPENKELAESTGTVKDVIISIDMISKMIAQVCREPDLERILQDFFDEEGVEIYFKPLPWYTDASDTVEFRDVLAASIARGEIAIGMDFPPSETSGSDTLDLNPPHDLKISVRDGVRVAVLAETEK